MVQDKRGHTYFQWAFSLLANATFLAYGLESGWISPTTKILQSDASPTGYPLSNNEITWIASSLCIAAIAGVSMYSHIADAYGRRIGVICIAIPQAISWIIKLSYASTPTLIVSRLFAGLAAGGCYNCVPMYVKEISQDNIRGILGTLPSIVQTTGVLIMYSIGVYLDYRTVITCAMVVPIVTTLVFLKAPESPAFLVKRGKMQDATDTIAFLRGLNKDDKVVENLIESIQNEESYFKSLPDVSVISLFKDKTWRRGIFLIMATFFFHAQNGAFVIVMYASTILLSTGVKFDISPELQVLSFPIVMILSSLLLIAVVERFGRKPLLMATHLISSCSMAAVASMMILQREGFVVPSWMPVIAMVISVSLYSGGVLPLPYIILTEMFSFQIRAKVVGVIVTLGWLMSSITVTSYLPLSTYISPFAPFIFYSVMNLCGCIYTYIFLPETRGKSEEEIHQMITKGNKPTAENKI